MSLMRIVVAAAIVNDLAMPRHLLAARRTGPADVAGRWELPGGKVEPPETPEQALHRELAEELGITVSVGVELLGPDGGGWALGARAVLRVWPAVIITGEPTALQDHDDLRWLPPGHWLDVDWLPADRPVVRAMHERAMDQGPTPAP
jgi:8-oxo-dGTP diphosphatase